MIVDSSVLLAIVLNEPSAAVCLQTLLDSPTLRISAGNMLEAAIVVDRLPDPVNALRFDELLDELGFTIESVTPHQARIAREAYRRFGKGSGHPAQLNFGDCFAYALAKELDEPLLFVGQDFVHTDIRPVLTQSLAAERGREADRILFLENDGLVKPGAHAELMSKSGRDVNLRGLQVAGCR